MASNKHRGEFVDQTPAEISAACEEIQAGWDEETRCRRRHGWGRVEARRDVRWSIPVVELPSKIRDMLTEGRVNLYGEGAE